MSQFDNFSLALVSWEIELNVIVGITVNIREVVVPYCFTLKEVDAEEIVA